MTGVEEVARLLRSGRTLAEIQRLTLPESWRRTVRTCAAAGTFGSALYDGVLARHAGPDAPALTELAGRGLVEPVDAAAGMWRVPREDAASWMLDWRVGWSEPGAPPELVALESELADWHAARGDRNEQLRHLLVADTPAAVELFDRLFRAADEARDHACCQDLLNVLDDPHRVTYAGRGVSRLRLDRAGYLRARLYWSVDYSRSAQFLEPDGLSERTDALLSGSGSRVWQLFAPTGSGKTVQLQWLVARRCVPAAADVPCARIDFDVVEPVNVARYPWLLLLEVADQLERRWPRRVFERLDLFSSYRSLTHRQTSELTRGAAKGIAAHDVEQIERQVTAAFVRRFNDAAGDEPVLLVVDTLEEVLLGSGGPDRLLRMLARLVEECPALRLVLAGRYDLRVRAPEAMAAFGPVESVELRDFTPAQATRYLTEIRKIHDPDLCRAVVERTGGHPFLVALFADLIEQDPDTTADELRSYREPGLRLLIDRVVRRIADPDVRWLVRYGVVPRRLRYDDVLSVMRPFLKHGRAGPSVQDDPRTDRHHLAGRDDVFPFGTAAQDDAELAAVWRRLLDYAAHSSWVSEPAGDGKTVVFHQNVRAPMRALISDREVFRDLHEAFRQRFERLAEESPEAPVASLREAIYHRVQMADPAAVDFWRTQVRRRRDLGDLDGLGDLARDLLGEDYVDEAGSPRPRADGKPLLPYAAVVQAYVWLAYLAVERARSERAAASDPLWAEAEQALAHAADARARGGEQVPATALEHALHAAVLCVRGDPTGALTLAEGALPAAADDERVDLLRVCGDARAALGDPAAESSYTGALDLAFASGRLDQVTAIILSLARQSVARGRLDEAVRWCERAGAPRSGGGSSAAWPLYARLLLERYEPATALRALRMVGPLRPVEESERARLSAEANLMLGRAEEALADLDRAATAAESMPAPARHTHKAEIHQLRGQVLAELLEVDDAEDSLLLASSLWSEIGFADGHPECSYLYCRFLLRDVGDLTAAARVRRPAAEAGDELGLLWDELSAELRAAQGLPETPVVDPAGDPGRPPGQVARAIAARLSWSWQRNGHLLPQLLDALGKIQPPSARLGVLDELRRCTEEVPADDAARVRPLFEPVGSGTGNAEDTALHRTLLAELERLSGRRRQARQLLEEVEPRLPPGRNGVLARWRWQQAMSRLGEPVETTRGGAPLVADAGYPLLRAAGLLVLASARPDGGRGIAGRAMLAEARTLCLRVERPTRWAADVARALGEATGDGSLLAVTDDLDRQLGILRTRRRPAGAGRVLADRPGERAVALTRPGSVPADLVDLQFRLVEDWPGMSRALGEILADGWPGSAGPGPDLRALRLESGDIAVHGLPWELAVRLDRGSGSLPGEWRQVAYRSLPEAAARIDTSWVQRALGAHGADLEVDGVMGPRTESALDVLTPEPGRLLLDPDLRAELEAGLAVEPGRQPVVVVVRPEASVLNAVSSHTDYGYDVTDLYATHGFRVRVVHGLGAELDTAVRGEPPAVLHVSARLDRRGSGPYFDLSPAETAERMESKARGADLKPKDVARWLHGCGPGREPLVVLDPPYPGSSYDVPWQLVLRNLFAATLVDEGHAPVVIATGVRETGGFYVDPIAAGVAQGLPLGTIVAQLRPPYDAATDDRLAEAGWKREADALAARATAVFAAPSAFTLPEVSRG